MIPLPEVSYEIDSDHWGDDIDVTDNTHHTNRRVNGLLTVTAIRFSTIYSEYDSTDLFTQFQLDFDEWTEEIFKLAANAACAPLRQILVSRGVWVDLPKGGRAYSYAANFMKLLKADKLPEWKAEYDEDKEKCIKFLKKAAADVKFKMAEKAAADIAVARPNFTPLPPDDRTTPPVDDRTTPSINVEVRNKQDAPPPPTDHQKPPVSSPPMMQVTSEHSKLISEFMKIYSQDSKKYGGEMYDILDYKLSVFKVSCDMIGLPPELYDKVFPWILKGRAHDYYYRDLAYLNYGMDMVAMKLREHFETDERRQAYLGEWNTTSLAKTIKENPEKTPLQCFEDMLDRLLMLNKGLAEPYRNDRVLRDQVINACRTTPQCAFSTCKPSATFEAVCADLRASIGVSVATSNVAMTLPASQFPMEDDGEQDDEDGYYDEDHNWVDRAYKGAGRGRGSFGGPYRGRGGTRQNRGRGGGQTSSRGGFYPASRARGSYGNTSGRRSRVCNICSRPGCWSTNHTPEERQKYYQAFVTSTAFHCDGYVATPQDYNAYLAETEGVQGIDEAFNTLSLTKGETQGTIQAHQDEPKNPFSATHHLTEVEDVTLNKMAAQLIDQAVYHALTKHDAFQQPIGEPPAEIFMFRDRYSSGKFQGIIPDSGAAGVSSGGQPQLEALQRVMPNLRVRAPGEESRVIKFGAGTAETTAIVTLPTPLGYIDFHIVPLNTPFLLCLQDMDKLHTYLDNTRNVLVQAEKIIPVVRKWGHPWLLLDQEEATVYHLSEQELRRLHRRMGHADTQRLANLLQRAGEDFDLGMLKEIQRVCHQCQMNEKSPGRFKFALKDDKEFNYSIFVDIMFIHGDPVLHVVDSAIWFNAATWLKDMKARTVWNALCYCWINAYIGPPDQIVHDAGTDFASSEFRQLAKDVFVAVKEVPIEAHNSVGLVERYHAPLRRAYLILEEELKGHGYTKQDLLQMAVKALNDTAGPDGLVPTLLAFGAYSRMSDADAPSATVAARTIALAKAMKEVRQITAQRMVKDALAMRNGPNALATLQLPLLSEVRVWKEKARDDRPGWVGPCKLVAIQGQTCTVQMPNGRQQNYRVTVVKPYNRDRTDADNETSPPEAEPTEQPPQATQPSTPPTQEEQPLRRSNRERRRPQRYNQGLPTIDEQFINSVLDEVFLSKKEIADKELAIKLRAEGVITTPGAPFEQSNWEEMDALIAKGTFEFIPYDPEKHAGERIFRSRLVNEIKNKNTVPYEKSRLVIQAYNDEGKEEILTQSPTIQKVSQRLIIALAPSLSLANIYLYARDIMQAYTCSASELARLILARLPDQLSDRFPSGTIMRVILPLYGVPEAGTHWWATYHKHNREKLAMETSTYDPCLLISTNPKAFGMLGMQTDDTLFLGMQTFAENEERSLQEAKLQSKPRKQLTEEQDIDYNGGNLTKIGKNILFQQKGQSKNIALATDLLSYRQQRARGAYVAQTCQPEAMFDLSVAAQQQEPTQQDYDALNKRLKWQMENQDRGIKYIAIRLNRAKLFVFVDGSFANNKDLSSQIGYTIMIATEDWTSDSTFRIKGNLVHYSSVKCKRVTRSVLASEIYGMVAGVDIAVCLATTLKKITDQLGMPEIPMIVCTDSYSLYECLVKLGTTKEKRLMIDIMALRQSYERREIFEVRWIDGKDNPADAMTKANPNKALEKFLDDNELMIKVDGWVER